jgi:putative transcriptional regulator
MNMSETDLTHITTTIAQIVKLRERLGLSQARFAETFGLPLPTYIQWEKFRRVPETPALVLLKVILEDYDTVARVVRRQRRRALLQ